MNTTDILIFALVAALMIFQIVWIAINWDFFRFGGELHRMIYRSGVAKKLRGWLKA